MNRPTPRQLLLFLSLLLGISSLFGSDEAGAEIRYACLDSNQTYRIFVSRYYPCDATSPITDPQLDIVSPGGCSVPSPLGNWIQGRMVDVTPLCPALPTACNSGTNPVAAGAREYLYYRDYDFSAAQPGCDDYEFRLTTCCRSDSIDSGSDGQRLYVTATHFDPFRCNRAPKFLFPALVYLDDSSEARVSFGANDPDGDSLAFALVPCRDTLGTAVNYLTGYSPLQPLGSNWITDLDPLTGNLHFTPNPGGAVVAPICLEVNEYRKGVLIGTYVRDVLIEVLSSLPNPPNANLPLLETPSVTNTISGGTWLDSFTVTASLGRPLAFELQVTDAEGDSTQVQWTRNLLGAEFFDQTDPTRRRDTFAAVDPLPAFTWNPQQGGRYAFGMQFWEKQWCGPRRSGDISIALLVQDTCLLARFDQDTLFICPGDSARISPGIRGDGLAPYQYTWSTSDTTDTLAVGTPGRYWVQVFDRDTLCVSSDTVVVAFAPYCVWPGDANNDGIANNLDVLAIGLGYAATGPARPNASLQWTGQPAIPWGDTLPGGIDRVFADTDGSDSISMADTLAISLNYGLNHPLKTGGKEGGPGDPLLFFGLPGSPAGPGDTLQIPVFLGTDTLPADSIYGIAFSITYDNTLVDSGSAHVLVPDTSWLGVRHQDLFSLQKDRFTDGQIDVGISRNDHIARTDYGRIARLDIIMIDDITGKRDIVDTLHVRFSEVTLIKANGEAVSVNLRDAAIPVSGNSSTGIRQQLDPDQVRVYPNPSQGMFFVESQLTGPLHLSIYNSSGQLLWQTDSHASKVRINLKDQPAGLYLLRFSHEQGTLTRKIQITD